VRALTRHPKKAKLPASVEVAGGDLGQPETLDAAFREIEAVHLINFNANTSSTLSRPAELVDRMITAGISRVTTFRGEERGALEEALERSSLIWTDLFVPVEFMANALGWAESIRKEGMVRTFGPTRSAMIHEADVGAVAAEVLTNDGHGGRTYTLTGPEAFTPADKIRILSGTLGIAIRHEELTEAEARAKWQPLGYPEPFIDFLAAWHRDTPASAYTVLPTVSGVTGRPARRFSHWVEEHKHAFSPALSPSAPTAPLL
jgi:uncharacterized protein YbjT (DUF2867 family)